MYCQYCDEEQSPRSRFCKTCGAKLLERTADQISVDLGKNRFLVDQIDRWVQSGMLDKETGEGLSAPAKKRIGALTIALAAANGEPLPEPIPAPAQAAPTVAAPPPAEPGQAPAPPPVAPAEIRETEPAGAPALSMSDLEPEAAPAPMKLPLGRRETEAAAASSAAVLASAIEPLDFPEPPRTPEQEIVERESTWAKIWRPFLSETIFWFAGLFLLLAGAFYWVAESEGVSRALWVSGLLAVYTSAFFYVGRRLARKPNLVSAGRVLSAISAAMGPFVVLALAPMKTSSPALLLGTSALAVPGLGALAWANASTFGEKARAPFVGFATALLALFAAVPFVGSPLLLAALDGAALAALWLFAPRVGEAREDRGHAMFLGGLAGWFALALVVRVHYQGSGYGFGWVEYGPLIALLVAVVLRAEKHLLRFHGGPSWLALLAYASLIVAAWAPFAHEARRFGPSFGITCLVITALLVEGAITWKSRGFTLASLIVGWLSFHALSGLVKLEWLLLFLGGLKSVTGYEGRSMPLNYDGLTTLFYLAGLAWVYHRARRADAAWAVGALRWFSLIVAGLLVIVGHLGDDLRPALVTSAVVFAGALACSYWLVHWRLAYLAAAALVFVGLDLGLVARLDAPQAATGLAGAALAAGAIALLVSAERARAFREVSLVAFAAAAATVPFAGLGWTACVAWAATGLAGLAVAFALGSGLPAAAGAIACAGAVLFGLDASGVALTFTAWAAHGLAFALLAGSGLAARPATATTAGRWFAWRLPLAAEGYDVVRGPLAFAGLALSVTAVVLSEAIRGPPAFALSCALFALAQLWLARRQASAFFLTIALLASTLAAMVAIQRDEGPKGLPLLALAAAGLVCAALAVLNHRSTRFRDLLRVPERRASLTFFVHALIFALLSGGGAFALHLSKQVWVSPAAIGVSVLTFLVVPRYNRWVGALAFAVLYATTALSLLVPVPWIAVVVASAGFVPLALGLVARLDPGLAARLTGGDPERLLGPLRSQARLFGLAGVVACAWIGVENPGSRSVVAAGVAVSAGFFALLPRLDEERSWLALFGAGSWIAVALLLPNGLVPLSLAAFAAVLVALGAVVGIFSEQSARVIGGTGLALGAASLGALSQGWPEPPTASLALHFALLGLALALAPRVFFTSVFIPLSAAAFALALERWLPHPDLSLALGLFAAALASLALALRRFPGLSGPVFGLRSHRAVAASLILSATVLSMVAGCYACWLTGPSTLPIAASFGLAAAVFVAGFAATEEPLLMAGASALLVVTFAAFDVRSELAFLLAHLALNLVLLGAGALGIAGTRRLADALFDLLEPGEKRGVPEPTRGVIVGTATALTQLSLLAIVLISVGRLLVFGPLGFLEPAWAPAMAGAQLVTAAHLLRRRPTLDSWHGLLIATLAALWLLGGREAWPYVAGAWAAALALLAWASTTRAGERVVAVMALGMPERTRLPLRATLSAYSTAVALLGVAITEGDPRLVATPVSVGLATLAFGLQALLGAPGGRLLLSLALPAFVHVAVFHAGIRLSTGRPEEAVLPALAAAMALVALAAERFGAWRQSRGGRGRAIVAGLVYAAIAAVEWIAAVPLVDFQTSDLWLCFAAGGSLTLLWTLRALATKQAWAAWLAQLTFLGVYVTARLQTDWLGPRGVRGDHDAIATLVLGVLFLGLHATVKRLDLPAFRSPTRFAAYALPVASALLMAGSARYASSLLLFAVALHLTALSWLEGRGKVSGVLAAIAYNLAIAVLWLTKGIGGGADAQYYVIPAGLTLLALAQVYRDSLGQVWQNRLRVVGSLAIYGASAWPALSAFEQPAYVWWAVTLSVAGAVLGVMLRVRAYLYLGMLFLVLCVVGNMVHYGLRDHRTGAVLLSLLGLAIIGAMIFFTSRREELLSRYRKYRALLAEWQ